MEQNITQKSNQTLVTVPEFYQVEKIPLALNDYALDNGASCHYRDIASAEMSGANSRQVYSFGETWVRPTNNGLLGVDTCAWTRGTSRRTVRSPETNAVGVAPRLENATAGNWGVTLADDDEVTTLTYNKQRVYYPRTRVSNELKAELLAARQGNGDTRATVVGAYRRPLRCNHGDTTLKSDIDICYAYRGRCYVNCKDELTNRDDWYLCEPVRAWANATANQIQCLEVLVNAPFDNVNHFADKVKSGTFTFDGAALDNFLNKTFMTDLILSTDLAQHMKLTHTKDTFSVDNLKANTTDLTASQLVR